MQPAHLGWLKCHPSPISNCTRVPMTRNYYGKSTGTWAPQPQPNPSVNFPSGARPVQCYSGKFWWALSSRGENLLVTSCIWTYTHTQRTQCMQSPPVFSRSFGVVHYEFFPSETREETKKETSQELRMLSSVTLKCQVLNCQTNCVNSENWKWDISVQCF